MFTKYLCGVVTKTPPDIAQMTGGFLTPWNGLSTSQSTHQRHVPGLTVPLATARLVPYDVPAPQDTKITRSVGHGLVKTCYRHRSIHGLRVLITLHYTITYQIRGGVKIEAPQFG